MIHLEANEPVITSHSHYLFSIFSSLGTDLLFPTIDTSGGNV